jgi:hypothetical protein
MDPFAPPPKPKSALGGHRVLSPTANVKVSPIQLGSIGNSWSKLFGVSEDADALLDAYFDLGGNFIDTSNTYNSEDSELLIGEWIEKRGNRDQIHGTAPFNPLFPTNLIFRKQQYGTRLTVADQLITR